MWASNIPRGECSIRTIWPYFSDIGRESRKRLCRIALRISVGWVSLLCGKCPWAWSHGRGVSVAGAWIPRKSDLVLCRRGLRVALYLRASILDAEIQRGTPLSIYRSDSRCTVCKKWATVYINTDEQPTSTTAFEFSCSCGRMIGGTGGTFAAAKHIPFGATVAQLQSA